MARRGASAAAALAFLALPVATSFTIRPRMVRMSAAVDATDAMPRSFVQKEMRDAAMKLHTRQQAPKEGKKEEPAHAPPQHETTVLDYAQFLLDSKLVYETFEQVCGAHDALKQFRDTGLERSGALARDLESLARDFDPAVADLKPGSHGPAYVARLKEYDEAMAASENAADSLDLARFMCHFYNHYFAHTAGGRMIGKKMAKAVLDDRELDFYKWDGDVKEFMTNVREDIDAMAAAWSDEQREACLDETAETFRLSGSLLRYLSGR